jgi:DNA-binding HxlR family transcriptional regulator
MTAPWDFLRPFSKRKLAPPVLHALEDGPQRYTDVLNRITLGAGQAIHCQTLSATLHWLRDHGYIAHRDEPTPEYWLTEDGRDLVQILTDIERVYQRRLRDRPDPAAR